MRGHDTAIFTLLYLILLTLGCHEIIKLIFLKPSSWPKTMYAEHWRKLAWALPWEMSYTVSTIILWSDCEQLLT